MRKNRYFHGVVSDAANEADGQERTYWLTKDGTGRYVWQDFVRIQIGGCYRTKAEARKDIAQCVGITTISWCGKISPEYK
jgi:hypothetical protein